MIFIIEGVDGAGKSTLINELVKNYPGLILKITDRPKDSSITQRTKIKEWYWKVLSAIDLIEKSGDLITKNFILDRFFPSEIVYSVKRGYESWGDQELRVIETRLAKFDHLLVYCDPGLGELDERIKTRGDEYIKREEAAFLHGRYKRFFEETPLNKIKIDTSKSVQSCLRLIHKRIKNEY